MYHKLRCYARSIKTVWLLYINKKTSYLFFFTTTYVTCFTHFIVIAIRFFGLFLFFTFLFWFFLIKKWRSLEAFSIMLQQKLNFPCLIYYLASNWCLIRWVFQSLISFSKMITYLNMFSSPHPWKKPSKVTSWRKCYFV